jgi:hypothetical protein
MIPSSVVSGSVLPPRAPVELAVAGGEVDHVIPPGLPVPNCHLFGRTCSSAHLKQLSWAATSPISLLARSQFTSSIGP